MSPKINILIFDYISSASSRFFSQFSQIYNLNITEVILCTTFCAIRNFEFFSQSVFICFLWFPELRAIISPNTLDGFIFVIGMQFVFCGVGTELKFLILFTWVTCFKGLTETELVYVFTYMLWGQSQCWIRMNFEFVIHRSRNVTYWPDFDLHWVVLCSRIRVDDCIDVIQNGEIAAF
jgi:hypothetical protein